VSTNGNGAHPARVQEIVLRDLDHGPERDVLADVERPAGLDAAYAAPSAGRRAAVAVAEDVSPIDPPDEPPDAGTGDNLWRYARWQARDFLRNRAIWLIPLGIVALWIFRDNYDVEKITRAMAAGARPGQVDTEPEAFRWITIALSAAGGLFGSLIATMGMVARERERGLQRFLFAKPISITRYYLQAFVINGLGFLAVQAAMLLLTALVFLRPVPFLDAMTLGLASYVMLGGFSFLLSTLVRFDFAAAGVLGVLSIPVFAAGERWRYPLATVGRWLLPPVPAIAQLAVPAEHIVPGGYVGALALCFGYGLACVAGGVLVLRRRSITT
jgi:hypothetical protein